MLHTRICRPSQKGLPLNRVVSPICKVQVLCKLAEATGLGFLAPRRIKLGNCSSFRGDNAIGLSAGSSWSCPVCGFFVEPGAFRRNSMSVVCVRAENGSQTEKSANETRPTIVRVPVYGTAGKTLFAREVPPSISVAAAFMEAVPGKGKGSLCGGFLICTLMNDHNKTSWLSPGQ